MPSRAHSRKDPLKGKKEFSTNKGFTLIEVMIVIGVVAILASLALPSYRTILEKRQVTSGAEQISAFISAVQFEAVKRGEPLAVNYLRTDTDTWCLGVTFSDKQLVIASKLAGDGAACEVDSVVAGVFQSTEPELSEDHELRMKQRRGHVCIRPGPWPVDQPRQNRLISS